tara:strand:+ start:128 stop:442 length:315 start_codon:yes stop_codon:yes gene_type:complete
MPKDMIVKAIETMLMGSPSEMAKMGPRLRNLINKAKKDKGKPKGRSPSMILGSASKAGMQSKQGQRLRPKRPRNPFGPKPSGPPKRRPISDFYRSKKTIVRKAR